MSLICDNSKQIGLIYRRLNNFPPLLVKNKGLRVGKNEGVITIVLKSHLGRHHFQKDMCMKCFSAVTLSCAIQSAYSTGK